MSTFNDNKDYREVKKCLNHLTWLMHGEFYILMSEDTLGMLEVWLRD